MHAVRCPGFASTHGPSHWGMGSPARRIRQPLDGPRLLQAPKSVALTLRYGKWLAQEIGSVKNVGTLCIL